MIGMWRMLGCSRRSMALLFVLTALIIMIRDKRKLAQPSRHVSETDRSNVASVDLPVSVTTRDNVRGTTVYLKHTGTTSPRSVARPDTIRRTVTVHDNDSSNPLVPKSMSFTTTGIESRLRDTTTGIESRLRDTTTGIESRLRDVAEYRLVPDTQDPHRSTPTFDELERVRCVHNYTYNSFGWRERGPLMYLRGCNRESVVNFEGWSRRSGCAKFELSELLVHVGWTGPWLPHFLPDMQALLDSFLATQDTSNAKLYFWLMDRHPDPHNDEIVRRYSKVSNGSIVFRYANVSELQDGTCIANKPYMWDPPGKIQPQTKSDLLRILLLHKFGGVWVDTDTILLRDLRPLVEFFGEFGGKFAMNQKFNNAILSLRKGSALSSSMIEMACQYPKSVSRQDISAFCAKTGHPCNPTWWYNHGHLQYFARKGWMVAMPLQFADPANNCVARGLLSKDGTRAIISPWTLSKVMELVRGSYLLHTRSYQATVRPLSNTSTFEVLFRYVRELAERRARGTANKASIVPHGLRTIKEERLYNQLLDMLDSAPYPDPPFFPEGRGRRVMISSRATSHAAARCLSFDTKGGRQPYELPLSVLCDHATHRKDERAVWLWHQLHNVPSHKAGPESVVGYLRPSFTRTSNVFCLTGVSVRKTAVLRYQECNGEARQQWARIPTEGKSSKVELLMNVNLKQCITLEYTNGTEPGALMLGDCKTVHDLHNSTMEFLFDHPKFIGAEASQVDSV